MKRIKISIDDILAVLEAMKENGTVDIIMFELDGLPALTDADDPDSAITFRTVSESGEVDEKDEIIH